MRFLIEVHARVKPECIQAFTDATLANARASVREPGIDRFDVLQDQADPTCFVLVEAYYSADAIAAHKATTHYAVWRDTVADMMAEPRSSRKFTSVFWTGA